MVITTLTNAREYNNEYLKTVFNEILHELDCSGIDTNKLDHLLSVKTDLTFVKEYENALGMYSYSVSKGYGEILIKPGVYDSLALCQILYHEIGHAMGYDHIDDSDHIMYYAIDVNSNIDIEEYNIMKQKFIDDIIYGEMRAEEWSIFDRKYIFLIITLLGMLACRILM